MSVPSQHPPLFITVLLGYSQYTSGVCGPPGLLGAEGLLVFMGSDSFSEPSELDRQNAHLPGGGTQKAHVGWNLCILRPVHARELQRTTQRASLSIQALVLAIGRRAELILLDRGITKPPCVWPHVVQVGT